MKKLMLFSLLLAFIASTGSYAQKEQRTPHYGCEKFRTLMENYTTSATQESLVYAPTGSAELFSEDFNEAGPGLPAGWTKIGNSDECTWNVDATPGFPGYYSSGACLNFNNGTDFNCDPGEDHGIYGAAISPAILVSGQPCSISFMYNIENECYNSDGGGGGGQYAAPTGQCGFDDTYLVILDENDYQIGEFFIDGSNSWKLNNYTFGNPGGNQYIKLAFYFDTYDDFLNNYYGPFVDDLQVTKAPVATPVSGWALAIGIMLITAFTILRIRRQA